MAKPSPLKGEFYKVDICEQRRIATNIDLIESLITTLRERHRYEAAAVESHAIKHGSLPPFPSFIWIRR